MSDVVFSVHVTKPDEVDAVEVIFTTEDEARAFAESRSQDYRIQSASVTRFVVGGLGTRHPVAWYVGGAEQPPRFNRQLYPTDGCHWS